MSACIWINVENRRKETLSDYQVSVKQDVESSRVTIKFTGTGRSGSADHHEPNHRATAGVELSVADALHLAQALLIASSSDKPQGRLTLALRPNATSKIRGLVNKRIIAETLSLQEVSQIVFSTVGEAQSR